MKNLIKTVLLTAMILTGVEGGEGKPTLTIYAYDSFTASWGAGPQIKKAFEKLHDCNLEFVPSSSAIGSLRKIQLEGKNTKADILLGLDTNIAKSAKSTGLFEKHGIELVTVDNGFDPNFHEAVMKVDSDEHDEGEVVQVLQKGYKIKDRLLRSAMVSIAK
jgi:thiamine transport system substrate-binding protein